MTSLWKALGVDAVSVEIVQAHERALAAETSPLTPAQTELIAVVVAATEGCGYCVAHHGPRLARALGDEGLARAVARDYREANLAARDRVLLDYAVALTCEPGERTEADLERVRDYGFDETAIVRATHLAAYFGLLDRLASGLGVEREHGVDAWEFGAQR
jgi:uncharacterized peroxidase-related enzyme